MHSQEANPSISGKDPTASALSQGSVCSEDSSSSEDSSVEAGVHLSESSSPYDTEPESSYVSFKVLCLSLYFLLREVARFAFVIWLLFRHMLFRCVYIIDQIILFASVFCQVNCSFAFVTGFVSFYEEGVWLRNQGAKRPWSQHLWQVSLILLEHPIHNSQFLLTDNDSVSKTVNLVID